MPRTSFAASTALLLTVAWATPGCSPPAPPDCADAAHPSADASPDAPLGYDAAPTRPAVALATGGGHNCVVLEDRTVQCWGDNGMGQLGDGTRRSRATPAPVPGLTDVTDLSLGGSFSCALLRDGTVRCWGENREGQIGTGALSLEPTLTPTPVVGLTGVVELAVGISHACARVADGRVLCWGGNSSGAVRESPGGRGGPAEPLPVELVGATPGARHVDAGGANTCVVLTDGAIRCFGDMQWNPMVPTPPRDESGGARLSVSHFHACARALTARGEVRCWGDNADGALGSGSTEQRWQVETALGVTGATDLASDRGTTCAVAGPQGAVLCWGTGSAGELGDGRTGVATYSATPRAVPGFDHAVRVRVGGTVERGYVCALRDDATVWCWGARAHTGVPAEPWDRGTLDPAQVVMP